MRTAESVVFTDCPPGPLDLNTSIWRSLGSISTSTSSASGSTATVAALVWIRPWLSVSGTRCTRCGPPSYLNHRQASSPFTAKVTSAIAAMIGLLPTQGLELQAMDLGESLVHAEEVARPDVRLFAALCTRDLDDHVPTLVRIARQQQLPDLRLERTESLLPPRDLALEELAHLRILLAGKHLPGLFEVVAGDPPRPERVDDRLQLRVAAPRIARGAPVALRIDRG